MVNNLYKKYSIIGCCGIDCGLCPRYHTEGNSRCPGCCGPEFFNKHPTCSRITCCVKTKNLETCGSCDEFPCAKFDSWFSEDAYDSFVTHKKTELNLNFIKKHGIEKFILQQNKRIELLKQMLNDFNEGRSKNYFCLAVALLSIKGLEKSIETTIQEIELLGVKKDDTKSKAKIFKKHLQKTAELESIDLKLRKPPDWR